mmetsp:Transcript_24812/g.52661  ORF Transcript_24812/g.52661 Transcript_24812/m.52661 type:complete len:83 (-) Transcript_24812:708-956(-)
MLKVSPSGIPTATGSRSSLRTSEFTIRVEYSGPSNWHQGIFREIAAQQSSARSQKVQCLAPRLMDSSPTDPDPENKSKWRTG